MTVMPYREEIAGCCKKLKLSSNLADNAMTATGENHQEYLYHLLRDEVDYRGKQRIKKLISSAGFGIIDNSFETFYQKLMEYGPGNYYYLRFGSGPQILVAMPMMQDPPDYDENGLLQNTTLRFVKTHRTTIEDWHIDNWGEIEAEHIEDNIVAISRTNMPVSVTYVDKVTGKTTEVKW